MIGGEVVGRIEPRSVYVVQLTAGQTLTIPVDVISAAIPLIRFYSGAGTMGVGTGRIRYPLGKAGIPDFAVNIGPTTAAGYGVPVFGHRYAGGPDLVTITCGTGTLEIEGIEWVAPRKGINPGSSGGITMPTAAAPATLAAPPAGYKSLVGPYTPFSIIVAIGANTNATIVARVTFHAGTGSGLSGIALAANHDPNDVSFGFRAG